MSDADNAVVAAFDRAAPTYDRVDVDFFGPMGAQLVRLAGLRPGATVLDVGCGRGAVVFPAAAAVGRSGQVTGIDLAPGMVDRTRADVAAAGLEHVDIRVDDAEDPAAAASSYDAILAGLVIFLLPQPSRALRAYYRLLRPAGRLGLSTIAAQDPTFTAVMAALAQHLPTRARQSPTTGQEALFATAESTTATLEANGFGDVVAVERPFVSTFRDAAHWVQWAWSHGARVLLERIPQEDLDTVLGAARELLDAARDSDGQIRFTTTIRFTFATRPSW